MFTVLQANFVGCVDKKKTRAAHLNLKIYFPNMLDKFFMS